MPDRINPLITFTLDGDTLDVDVDAITALDIAVLAPFISYPDLIGQVNDGPTVMAAGALRYLGLKQAGRQVQVAEAFDEVSMVSEFSVALADAAEPDAAETDAA